MSDQRLREAERRAKEEATPDAWHAFVRVAIQAGQEEQAAWREICGIGRYDVLVWEYESTGTIHVVDPQWDPRPSDWRAKHMQYRKPVLCGSHVAGGVCVEGFNLDNTRWEDWRAFRPDEGDACGACPKTLTWERGPRPLQVAQAKLIGELPYLCRIGSHRRATFKVEDGYSLSAQYGDDEPAPCEDCGMILPPVAVAP